MIKVDTIEEVLAMYPTVEGVNGEVTVSYDGKSWRTPAGDVAKGLRNAIAWLPAQQFSITVNLGWTEETVEFTCDNPDAEMTEAWEAQFIREEEDPMPENETTESVEEPMVVNEAQRVMAVGLARDVTMGRLAKYYDTLEIDSALLLIKENPTVENALSVMEEVAPQLGTTVRGLIEELFPSLSKAIEASINSEEVLARRTSRACQYLRTYIVLPRVEKDEKGMPTERYIGVHYQDGAWRAPGALESLLTALGHEKPGDFVQIEGLEVLGRPDETGLSPECRRFFTDLDSKGWMIVHRNLAVRKDSIMGQAMISLLGDIQGIGAYGGTLINAPIDPVKEGKILVTRVFFDNFTHGEDGSGLCSPDVVDGFPHQFRAIELDSCTFAKGIVAPRDNLVAYQVDGDWKVSYDGVVPPNAINVQTTGIIILDYKQVKGTRRLWAKAQTSVTALDNVGVAFIQVWMRRNTMSSCFEILQHFPPTARTRDLLRELIFSAIKKLNTDWKQHLEEAAKGSPSLARFIRVLESVGIDPLVVPSNAQAAVAAAESKMYGIAQGGGISGDYKVIIMDNRVPKGSIVLAGKKTGSEVACWRFPMLHALGLQVLTVENPADYPEFFCNGKLPPETAFLNPQDVANMQGDDDGDCIAVSADPRVVELFKSGRERWGRQYRIENPAKAKSTQVNGFESTIWGPKIPALVGQATVLQAVMYTIRAREIGDLVAWIIQAAVDSPKKPSQLLNLDKVRDCRPELIFVKNEDHWEVNPMLWRRDNNGNILSGYYNSREVSKFGLAIASQHGATIETELGEQIAPVLQWRNPLKDYGETKKVALAPRGAEKTVFSKLKQERFRNVVHGSYDMAVEAHRSFSQKLPEQCADSDIAYLLGTQLYKAGKIDANWNTQFEDSDILGDPELVAYRKRVGSAMKKGRNIDALLEQAAGQALSQLNKRPLAWWACAWRALHLSEKGRAQGIYSLLQHEDCTILSNSVVGKDRCKFAKISETGARALAFTGSPDQLGAKLAEYVFTDVLHATHHPDGTTLGQCKECQDVRKKHVVDNWRASQEDRNRVVCAELVTSLNQMLRDSELGFSESF